MSDITIRFSIFSNTEKDNRSLKALLKQPDSFTILGTPILNLNQKKSGKHHKETAYDYIYNFTDVNNLEECNLLWMNEWKDNFNSLLNIGINYDFKFHLNYEIVVFNGAFPSLYFQPTFLKFLGSLNIELSLYFYEEQ